MPTCFATANAVARLSPVSRIGRRPKSRNAAMAAALFALGRSATTHTPCTVPLIATKMPMLPPVRAATSASFMAAGISTSFRRMRVSLPAITLVPLTKPIVPIPGRFSKSVTLCSVPRSDRAAVAIALATGCSLACSSAPANDNNSDRVTPSAHTTSTNCIIPVVTVPVLSNTTVSTRRVPCNTSAPLMTIPICAARPLPTINAVGVASPKAQGQAMINTATAAVKACEMSSPITHHTTNVAMEITITVGTNTPLTRSASFCTGALVAWASRMRRVIWAKVESAPMRVACTTSRPVRFTVVPVTLAPTVTSTGTLSPVSIETSSDELPSQTMPSAAMISPGRTMNKSPTCTWDASINISSPSRKTVACRAPNANSERSASPARRLARASK